MLDILYEDNHLLVLNKPSGVPTQPTEHHPDSLETQAKQWIKDTYHKPGNVYLHAVHRLDRPTSGIVVFARTSKALSRLNETLRQKQAHKIYLAWVEGSLPDEETLENYLHHEAHHARIVDKDHPGAKRARLTYRIKEKNRFTLVEIELETGRYHQIRAQFAAIGCPILGDQKYGSHHSWKEGGIALHHHTLIIPHPTKGEELKLVAPLPQDFRKCSRSLTHSRSFKVKRTKAK